MSHSSKTPQAAKTATAIEWIMPIAFILVFGWVVWNGANYLIAAPGAEATEAALIRRYGMADIWDWIALILAPILFALGVATARRSPMEWEDFSLPDRLAVFIGRIAMMLVAILVGVMFYEVIARYVFAAPTLWANEMSLWLAVFIFLLAGLYAMQQRSHIRIYLLYDVCPRWVQRTFDVISTGLILLFAFMLFWGGYNEARDKFLRWETFGTAFDPPIPATVKPLILVVVALVALQAIFNLIRDWNLAPVVHSAADDIDEEELRRLREQVSREGVGEEDVTRGRVQQTHPRADD
ncbi:TRAP transporter small permease subunit [Jannaschia aquimarina]|uniref:TRAP transporter small permease protein n=1 Tax=Jannaschia aquimarina TaxID=935700 RepID=A0A0D1EHD9_9RHOB|nr:TRAP transporter small permease [Jannaschia aquimarina]KIT15240.1 2,3-diketo-L-gulonate TRAP transporter small permease protein YiaM [Jannaschia aquimarina]SNT32433.1 TRAP-type mannitol/chloroaromatic compound transport system, small permease component [Jannaschia aquimarina]